MFKLGCECVVCVYVCMWVCVAVCLFNVYVQTGRLPVVCMYGYVLCVCVCVFLNVCVCL